MSTDTTVPGQTPAANRPSEGHRFAPGALARVVRDTAGCSCTAAAAEAGVVVTLTHPLDLGGNPAWSMYGAPWFCPLCQRLVWGFAEADLEPVEQPQVVAA